MARYLIGADIGTTGVKALVMETRRGRVLGSHTVGYPLHMPHAGWAEQNPDDWVEATVAAVRGALAEAGIAPADVTGLALSGQMHGLVCLDKDGRPLRPAILWCDTRTTSQCREIEEAVGGRQKLISLVSNPALEGFTLPKLLWVRRHEKTVFSKTKTILLPKDYVRFRLTREPGIDLSDAAGTLMLDVNRSQWSRHVMDALRLPMEMLPRLGGSAEIAGGLTSEMAEATGLPKGLPVAFGGADNTCAAIGNGIISEGTVAISIGSSGTVISPTARPVRDKLGRAHTFTHSVPHTWYVMGVMQAAGLSLKWLRDELCAVEAAAAQSLGEDWYALAGNQAGEVPAGAEGLFWLPYLNGERTPHLDPHARGVLFGVTPRHSRGHVLRAMMEGVAYALADSLDIIRSLRIPIQEVRITGGGAKSPLWRQIVADVIDMPVSTINAAEGPAYGAALIAGVAVGAYPDLDRATASLIKVTGTTTPNSESGAVYRRNRAVFRQLYGALKPSFEKVARHAGN